MKEIFLAIFSLVFIVSCKFNKPIIYINDNTLSGNKYAKGFSIEYIDNTKMINVINPWQKANNITISYKLTSDSVSGDKNEICIPVKKVICLSTTYSAIIDELGVTESIVGISGSKYVCNPNILDKVKKEEILDIGYIGTLNYESILKLCPDVVFVYGTSADILQSVNKLQELDIKTVITGEYLENHPLGRLEWIKFLAAFYNLEDIAEHKFDSIVNNYNDLILMTDTIKNKPLVISGSPWRGTWYIPGGKSDMAKLINDAAGNYVWNHLNTHENVPLNFENIFVNSLNADYWINTGYTRKKSDLTEMDERFGKIKAYKIGNVYNNNKIMNETGGLDYYESGIIHPDIILNDMIQIFHPDLFPGRELFYYKKLE